MYVCVGVCMCVGCGCIYIVDVRTCIHVCRLEACSSTYVQVGVLYVGSGAIRRLDL